MEKIEEIYSFFDEIDPNPKCYLNYNTDYGFLMAVVLSAQTTDESVNKVTPQLFLDFPTLQAFKDGDIKLIEKDISTLGLAKNKAKYLKGIATDLIDKYGGVVPQDKISLLSLPGVGIKTSNVVRAELFLIPEIAVDTHVDRVSKRLGLCPYSYNVSEVEDKLNNLISKDKYIRMHHQMIYFGRHICKSQNPKCELCKLSKYCKKK